MCKNANPLSHNQFVFNLTVMHRLL
jgi:hypothetical protein